MGDQKASLGWSLIATLRGGNPAHPRAGATTDLVAGPGRVTVAVSAAKLVAIGTPWQRLDRAVLLRVVDAEFRIVAELVDVDLTALTINLAPTCL